MARASSLLSQWAVSSPTGVNLSMSWLNENVRRINLRRMEPPL